MKRLLALVLALPLLAACGGDSKPKPKPAPTATTAPASSPSAQKPPPPDLRDSSPEGGSLRDEQGKGDEVQRSANEQQLDEPRLLGGAENYSCPVQLVRNFSDRAPGVKVTEFVLHVTVSGHFSGPSIVSFFNSASAGASSHLVLQPDGWCRQIVPWAKKAWTQGAFNSSSESVEITAMGTEPRSWWLSQPIFTKGILASIMRDRMRARGIPFRMVDPVGCNAPAGFTDHLRLECGNNHVDVGPGFPFDVLKRQLGQAPTDADRVTCRKLNWWRTNGRPKGEAEANAIRRRKALEARNVLCRPSGPVLV